MRNSNILFIVLIGVFCFSCSGIKKIQNVADENDQVKKFLERFDKEAFLRQVEEQRTLHEDVVRQLKKEGRETQGLKLKYLDTQRAYNNVLQKMRSDIKGVKNIAAFQFFDTKSKYAEDLVEAQKVGNIFISDASEQLKTELLTGGIIKFVVNKIYPFIKKVHETYLNHVKLKMSDRIQQSEFRFWDDIE